MEKINWGTIIPLIGGMAVGNQKAFGSEPMWAVSFEGYEANNESFKNYWPKTKFHTFKNSGDIPDIGDLPYADVITTVCPCAGLSMLNCSTKGSNKSRGCNALQNEWMYVSAEMALGTHLPRVFMGENAPGLFTRSGQEVRLRLYEIAKEYGYSLSFVKTNTHFHGIPQHRQRSFYFFWDSDNAPIMNYEQTTPPPLHEYLTQIPVDASQQELINPDLSDDPSFVFIREMLGSNWRDFFIKEKLLNTWGFIVKFDKFVEFENFLDQYPNDHKKARKYLRRSGDIQEKLANGKGYWNDSMTFFGRDSINAVITKNIVMAVHPTEDRSFTIREALHMMGHPHDFELVGGRKRLNTVFQNVPSCTARYWSSQVQLYLEDKLEFSDTDYLMQSNHKQKIWRTEPEL
jgi:site-specific DNA-cytosine methylase